MLVIIDGECTFCRWASDILQRLCKPLLTIVPFENISKDILQVWESHPSWPIDSIKVISKGQLYIKSKAISEVLQFAKWYAQPLRLVFILPDRLLDYGYDWIAKNRKTDSCALNQ